MKSAQKHIKGFTLIELLISVGIITILASIAVPNFLEAQTRSKVSRVKNDLRVIAGALEAYHADHNVYPVWMDGYPYIYCFQGCLPILSGETGKICPGKITRLLYLDHPADGLLCLFYVGYQLILPTDEPSTIIIQVFILDDDQFFRYAQLGITIICQVKEAANVLIVLS